MKKPEKKEYANDQTFDRGSKHDHEVYGFNQGLDDMEAYYKGSELSEGEITRIMIDTLAEGQKNNVVTFAGRQMGTRFKLSQTIAKAIISARDKKRGGK